MQVYVWCYVVYVWSGDHRYLHVLTHSVPTRRSSDLSISTASPEIMTSISSSPSGQWRCDDQAPGFSTTWLAAKSVSPEGGARRRYQRPCTGRSEEHTSELQSLMRISYAVFCLTKNNQPCQ